MDTQTFYEKISKVPPAIRSQFGSDTTINILENVNQHFKVSGKNQFIISKIIQRLEIKEVDAEYFSGEIASQLSIDKNTALAITAEIKRIVFAPIRKELSDYGIDINLLDKFQMPLMKSATQTDVASSQFAPPSAGPKMLSETFTAGPNAAMRVPPKPAMGQPTAASAQAVPSPKPTASGQPIISQTATELSLGATPFGSNKNAAAPAPQPAGAKSAPDKGWSRQVPQDPVLKLGVITPSVPMPGNPALSPSSTGAAPKSIASSTPSSTGSKTLGEFERLDIAKKISPPATTPAPSTIPVPKPAPIMLHEVDSSTTRQDTPNFQVRPVMENQITRTPVPNAGFSTKPAVLEFGGGGVPKPPIAPNPPVPKPPQNKVIVEDFLGPQK